MSEKTLLQKLAAKLASNKESATDSTNLDEHLDAVLDEHFDSIAAAHSNNHFSQHSSRPSVM